jgi:hypothetical protein
MSPNGTPLTCGSVGDCSVSEAPNHVCDAGGNDGSSPPPPPGLCNDPSINTEPGILVGYSPAVGQTVGRDGQIKVWVNDEHPPFLAPGEQVDPVSGAVTMPGNRTAAAPDGLLWEPAVYFAPQTPLNGGTPYFPQWIKGWYNNAPPSTSGGFEVPGMDPPPPGTALRDKFTSEDIWDVSALGLPAGTYTAVFVIHDGDRDRAIGCITLVIASD